MRKIFGILFLIVSGIGFCAFIGYLIFESKDYGDDGLGSLAVLIGGWVGLIIGILSLTIALFLINSKRKKNKL